VVSVFTALTPFGGPQSFRWSEGTLGNACLTLLTAVQGRIGVTEERLRIDRR
jgi:hypothetical protein